MNSFVVHSIPGSPFGRSALLVLEEKRVPYRFAPVAPGALRGPEHLARHPFGRVPVLEHGDFRLFESQAILRYLDRLIPDPPLTPGSLRAQAQMDQLMNINDWYLFHGVASVIAFQRIIRPAVLGLATDEAAIVAAMPKAQVVFDELARELGQQDYFVGESPTLADFLIAPQLDVLRTTPEWKQLTGAHSPLDGWLDRMNGRPSMRATTWERVSAMAQAA
jgi:glutathione S-transferase